MTHRSAVAVGGGRGKPRPYVTLVLGALLLLAACTVPGSGPRSGDDLVIGVPVSLTGAGSKEGALVKQGYDLWASWANRQGGIVTDGASHRVQLRYEDDQSDPAMAGAMARQLIKDQHASFLLGPFGSSNTAAVAAEAEAAQVPLVATNGAAPDIYTRGYRYVFDVESPANRYLDSVLDLAATLNPKPSSVALISADDSFSTDVAKDAAAYASRLGLNVVFNQQYPSGSTNLLAILAQAKAKTPDILLDSGHLVEAIAIGKAVRDLRLDARMVAYSAGAATPDFVRALGKDANFTYAGAQWSPQTRYRPAFYLSADAYVAAYQSAYGATEMPSYQVAAATAGGLALQRAIVDAGSLEPGPVRNALAALDLTTFFGTIRFDSHGVNTAKQMVVVQVQNGAPVTVWPKEQASSAASYPSPPWDTRTASAPVTANNPASAPKAPNTGWTTG